MSDYGYRVEPANECHVSPAVRSQWRNGEHWHTVWPDNGGAWCFETQAEANERRRELIELEFLRRWPEPLPSDGPEFHTDHAFWLDAAKRHGVSA